MGLNYVGRNFMEANLTDKVKLLPWLQSIITERKMSDSVFFQLTDLLHSGDRGGSGDDDAIVEPLISQS